MSLDINSPTSAALLGVGGNIASGLFNLIDTGGAMHRQRKLMRYQSQLQSDLMAQQNAYNMALYQRQYDDNMKMWDLNNAYNTPAAQRKRLEDAGYNPYALLGQNGTQGTSQHLPNPPTASGVNGSAVGMAEPLRNDFSFLGNAIKDYMSSKMMYEQVREQSAKSDMTEQDAKYKEMRLLLDIRNALADERKKLADAKLSDFQREEIEQNITFLENTWNARVSVLNATSEKLAKEMSVLDSQANLLDEQRLNAIVERAAAQAGIKLTYAKIGEVAATIQNLQSLSGLNAAQTKRVYIQALGDVIGNGAAAKLLEALPSDIEYNQGWFKRYVSGLFGGAGSAVAGALTKGAVK